MNKTKRFRLIYQRFSLTITIVVFSFFTSFSQNNYTFQPVVQTSHTNIIQHYITSHNRKLLITSDHLTCKLWHLKSGSLLRTFDAEFAFFNKNGDIVTIKSLGEDYSEVSIANIDTLSTTKSIYINATYKKVFWNADSSAILINSGRNNFSECGNVIINPQTLNIIHSFNAYNVLANTLNILVVNYIDNRKGGGEYTCSSMNFSGKVEWTKKLPKRYISCCSSTDFHINDNQFVFNHFGYSFGKKTDYVTAFNIENGKTVNPQNIDYNKNDFGYNIRNGITVDGRKFGIDIGYSGNNNRFVELLTNNSYKTIAKDIAYIGINDSKKEIFLSNTDGTFNVFDLKTESINTISNVQKSNTKIKNGFLMGEYFYFFTEENIIYSLNIIDFKLTKLSADFFIGDLNITINHELGKALFYSEVYSDKGSPTIKNRSKYYIIDNNKLTEQSGRPLCMSEDMKYVIVENTNNIKLFNIETGEIKLMFDLKEKSINMAKISPNSLYAAVAIGNQINLYNLQNNNNISKTFVFDEDAKSTIDFGKNYHKSSMSGYEKININWQQNSQYLSVAYRGFSTIYSENLNLKLENLGSGFFDNSGENLLFVDNYTLTISKIGNTNNSKKHEIGKECRIIPLGFNIVILIKSDKLSLLDITTLNETEIKLNPQTKVNILSKFKLIKTKEDLRLMLLNQGSITYFDTKSGYILKQIKLPTNNYNYVHLLDGKYTLAYDEIYLSQMYKINNETGEFYIFPPGHLPIFSSPHLVGEVYSNYSTIIGNSIFSNHRSIFANKLNEVLPNNLNCKYLFTFSLNGSLYVFNFETNEIIVSIMLGQDQFLLLAQDNYYSKSTQLSNINFSRNQELFDFEQFDLKYNRPDIIMDRLGIVDIRLIEAYKNAYLKRLKKLGFTEDMLNDDIHIPELKIENFEQLPNTTNESSIELNLKLMDAEYKLDKINVWINDVAIYGTQGIDIRDKNTQEYATTLKLNLSKGNNKIQLSVLNQVGAESFKETFTVNCKAGKEKPNLYIVTIGVSTFKQIQYNLKFAAKDAEDMAKVYANNKNYGKVVTKTLTNQEVTKENIEQLREFLKAADINDEVMVFFAGHGVLDAQLDYYLASYDMDFSNPAAKGIAYESLERLLDGIAPLKKILLIDACHSGEIDKDEVAITTTTEVEEGDVKFRNVGNTIANKESHLGLQNTSELTKSLFADLRKGTGATVISSAGGMEFAMESSQWQNGLFTYCYINGLQSKAADLNKDGVIMLSELQQYVATQVTKLSNGKQQPTSRIENNVLDWRVW
jgi:hypothetical protein